jgi:hypothetical protein
MFGVGATAGVASEAEPGWDRALRRAKSGLPSRAGMTRLPEHVRFGPQAEVGSLFDNFIGAG